MLLLVNCTKIVIWQSGRAGTWHAGTHVVMAANVKSEESSVMQTKSDDGAATAHTLARHKL